MIDWKQAFDCQCPKLGIKFLILDSTLALHLTTTRAMLPLTLLRMDTSSPLKI